MTRSWVASVRSSVPIRSPSCMTITRSLIPSTSGSSAEAILDLLAGRIDVAFDDVTFFNSVMDKPDESLAKLEEALHSMPENTGVLMAAAQLHLLWMSQRGINQDYVKRVNRYLNTLDRLIPGNDRVSKMHKFLRDAVAKAAQKS